jgi:preprotein translocase subunit SecG
VGTTMETMIWFAVLLVLVLLVAALIKRKKSKKTTVYVCGQCGEKDFECTKQLK